MIVAFAGHNIRGVKCLQTLIQRGYNIPLVIGHPQSGHSTDNVSVRSVAESEGIDFFAPEKVNSAESLEKIESYKPDVMVLAGYGQIVRSKFLGIARKMTINLHGGKLPEYRGSSPLNWMIINGETTGGISIIEVDEGIDTGDILAQATFPISDDDDILSVREKTLEIFPELLVQTLEKINSDSVVRIKQKLSDGGYYPVRTPNDGLIIWEHMTALQVRNLTRALSRPYPSAFTFHRGKKILVHKVSMMEQTVYGIPGRIQQKQGKKVAVMCKDHCVWLDHFEMENGDPLVLNRGDNLRTHRTILLGDHS